ncbi:MAG: hypothetical protein PUF50_03035, partial [Erysipelotrichaceae bacterium]|nr:hypothetical protein [Erysipelotrichaceae bacterium]
MKNIIKVYDIRNLSHSISLKFQPPRTCPHCDVSTNNDEIYGVYVAKNDHGYKHILITFFCNVCEHFYVAEYTGSYAFSQGEYEADSATFIYPQKRTKHKFTENISNLSPKFIEIYNQALQAETLGLNEICGMGYRKAL